jgi:hypothetical protein
MAGDHMGRSRVLGANRQVCSHCHSRPRPTDDLPLRQRIITTARDLFYRQGFRRTLRRLSPTAASAKQLPAVKVVEDWLPVTLAPPR